MVSAVRASEQKPKRAPAERASEQNPERAFAEAPERLSERASKAYASEHQKKTDQDMLESIRRCQVNLGHPSLQRFLHMLKSSWACEKAI